MKPNSTKDTSQSLIFSSLHSGEDIEVTDEAVNAAINYFDYERMLQYHGIHVKTNRNFMSKKDTKPDEWHNFELVVRLCRKNNFHLRCYIKYSFLNVLMPKARGKMLSDIILLRETSTVIRYAKNRDEVEKLYGIYVSIMQTVMMIKRYAKANSTTPRKALKDILSSGEVTEMTTTGALSKYFLSLLGNAAVVIHGLVDMNIEDFSVMNDLCGSMSRLGVSAAKAMRMFYPSSATKTIMKICEE